MKRYIQAITCVALISGCLLGCGKQDQDYLAQESEITYTEDFDNTVSNEDPTDYRTQHVFQEFSENLSIDAEVVIPVKNEYSTYTLKMVTSTPEKLFDLFCPEGHGEYTMEDRDYYVVYSESSGKKLIVRDNTISYSAYNLDLGDHPMQEVSNLMYYHTQEHPQVLPHDLSFMTVSEMEEFCKDILTKLGIAWEPELLHFVTLSGQEILNFQQEMFGKDYYTEMGTPMRLTEAKDTCYLEFSFSYNGIPILGPGEPPISFMDGVRPPETVKATIMINADGIQDFDMNCTCTVEPASEVQTILTIDEAIAILKAKYDLEILFGSQKITDIWMEYIPVKQNQSIVLTPYWCFSNSLLMEGSDGTSYWSESVNADRINAITGKDLAYGG